MATKKKRVYEEGVDRWKLKRQEMRRNRLVFIVECPFCNSVMDLDLQASMKTGKNCKTSKCSAVHWPNGYACRGYTPGITPDQEVDKAIESQLDAPENEELRSRLGVQS